MQVNYEMCVYRFSIAKALIATLRPEYMSTEEHEKGNLLTLISVAVSSTRRALETYTGGRQGLAMKGMMVFEEEEQSLS